MHWLKSGRNIWRLEGRRRSWFALSTALVAIAGVCAANQGTAASARIGENFDLRVGQTVTIAGEPLAVTFEQVVEDSRCPTNTTCVWAGTAVVRTGVRVSERERGALNLQTLSEAGREGVFQRYRVRLIQLAPAPADSSAIPTEQYVLTLVVRKLP